MQRIIHGDANDHRRDSDDDDRHTVPDQGDASNGEKPAESDRDHNPKDVREAFVCEDKQQTDKEQGQRNGQYAVLFDLCSVGDGYQRRTHSGHGDLRMLCPKPIYGLIDKFRHLGIHPRLTRPIWRGQEGKPVAVLCEYAVIDNVIVRVGGTGPEPLKHRSEQMQRIRSDIGDHRVSGREQQRLTVRLKLPTNVVLNIQKRVNPLIVSLGHIQWIAGGDEFHHLERHSAVNRDLPLRNEAGGVHSVENALEIVDRLGNLVLTGL